MREKQSKATQERHERMLNALFQVPGNDRCADCTAKNPRWASYSLGVFLCIRCASLHRKMGTHISKVKSVSMDRWTLQEIQYMTKLGGNSVVNSQINTNPQKNPLPIALDDDHAMERYIRDKWEKMQFKQAEEPIINKITELNQIGDSSTSLSSSNCSTILQSPSPSHSTSMTPSQELFAGQNSFTTNNNPFKMINQHTTSYNSFISSSSSTMDSSVVTTPTITTSNNPFILSNQLQQSPFDIHSSSYFTAKSNPTTTITNPFLSQQQ